MSLIDVKTLLRQPEKPPGKSENIAFCHARQSILQRKKDKVRAQD